MMGFLRILFSVCLSFFIQAAVAQNFPNSGEDPPVGYTGKIFKLSQDYPAQFASETKLPWMSIDYKKEPLKYVETVYQYILEGNKECDWVVQNNKVRKWYHVPWMHWSAPKEGVQGREFINGLTRERDSRPFELSPIQYDFKQNWAIGIYNNAGGYVIGEVWKDPNHPDPSKANFPYGTVCGKLLFTEADTVIAPYLKGAPIWFANIHANVNEKIKKAVRPVHLLQFDIAVRDSRADNEAGWVFGTLIYDGDLPASDPWQRMVPAGVIWGNDANITPERVNNGESLKESFVNPVIKGKFKFGWAGRLNGPVDNPGSSCISCHSTAEYPMLSSQSPPDNASTSERLHWFSNTLQTGKPFTHGAVSLHYSMQLAKSFESFYMHQSLIRADGKSTIWKNRLNRLFSGGYIFVLTLLILLFYIISKYAADKIKFQPFTTFDSAIFILRIGIGLMFMFHGYGKVAGGAATWVKLGQSMANTGIYFFPEWWGFMAAFAEFGGGLLMIFGLFFRPVLFMMCIHITIAFLRHLNSGDSLETASHSIEIWFVFLFLLLTGPGKFSLDYKLYRKRNIQINSR